MGPRYFRRGVNHRARGGPGHQGVGVGHPMWNSALPARVAALAKKTKKDKAQNRNGATSDLETARAGASSLDRRPQSVLAVLAIKDRAGPFCDQRGPRARSLRQIPKAAGATNLFAPNKTNTPEGISFSPDYLCPKNAAPAGGLIPCTLSTDCYTSNKL